MATPSIADQLVAARKAIDDAGRLRATAEAQQEMARKRVAEIDAELHGLGVDPNKVEDEIKALHTTLQQSLQELTAKVQEELTVYAQIAEAAK